MFSKPAAWSFALLGLFITVPVWARGGDAAPPMPPNYPLPQVADPVPQPEQYSNGRFVPLSFWGPDRVVHEQRLDRTPRGWLDGLLDIVIGGPVPWSPTWGYRLFPVGLPQWAGHEHAVAMIDGRLIVFDGSLAGRPGATLKSLVPRGYRLQLDGVEAVVTRGYERRWVFTPSDHGRRWSLSRMEQSRFPQQSTVLHYKDTALVGIMLPNERLVEFEVESGLPVRCTMPWGIEVKFERNEAGRVTRLEKSRVFPNGTRRRRLARLGYDYDASGRLAEFTTTNRLTWRCTYDAHQTRQEREQTARITSGLDRLYLLRQTITRDGTRTSIPAAGYRSTSLVAAVEQYRHRAAQRQAWQPRPSRSATDRIGPAWDIGPWLNHTPLTHGLRLWQNAAHEDRATAIPEGAEVDAFGRLVTRPRPGAEPIRYVYAPSGNLVQATVPGEEEPHKFETNPWGQLTKHIRPNGTYREWVFNEFLELTEIVDAVPLPKDPSDLFAETRFRTVATQLDRDEYGRLTKIQSDTGSRERFQYDARGRMEFHFPLQGGRVRFRYDRHGRMIQRFDASGGRDDFEYHPDGSIAQHARRPRGEPFAIREYNLRDQLVAEHIERMGRTQYEYDDQGRRVRVIHPNGKDTVYTYDELNRVIKIRGSQQPPVNISYDAAGNRTVSSPQ